MAAWICQRGRVWLPFIGGNGGRSSGGRGDCYQLPAAAVLCPLLCRWRGCRCSYVVRWFCRLVAAALPFPSGCNRWAAVMVWERGRRGSASAGAFIGGRCRSIEAARFVGVVAGDGVGVWPPGCPLLCRSRSRPGVTGGAVMVWARCRVDLPAAGGSLPGSLPWAWLPV